MFDLTTLRSFGEAVISIFAIVNPIGGLPIFVALTEDSETQERRRLFRLAGIAALVIVCVMALAGQFLLEVVFQIEVRELLFGGGLLLVVIGIQDLVRVPESRRAAAVESQEQRRVERLGLAISPIASPLLAGPGCIVTVMLLVGQHGRFFALAACLVAFFFVILILNFAHVVYRLMGRLVALAVGRVMEIFIVAIGVKFCYLGIIQAFPWLAR